jgi:lipoate-protein ligase A
MAIDEALLASFTPGQSQPILRTYGWAPPALSLGRFQNASDVLDLERCRHSSMDIVRRVSGGGTIYHADELTYSIVCTQEHIPVASSVKDSFRVLTGFLIEFYRALGLNASYAVDTASRDDILGVRSAFCFAGRESFDIIIDSRKIGGNAQRRHRNVIFQHGSIPIINHSRSGLQYMRDRTPAHAEQSISLTECGITVDYELLTGRLVEAFSLHLNVTTCEGGLTAAEIARAQQLREHKYSLEMWNLKGELML